MSMYSIVIMHIFYMSFCDTKCLMYGTYLAVDVLIYRCPLLLNLCHRLTMPMCSVCNDKSESAKGSNTDCLTVINRMCGDPFAGSLQMGLL